MSISWAMAELAINASGDGLPLPPWRCAWLLTQPGREAFRWTAPALWRSCTGPARPPFGDPYVRERKVP